MAFGNFSTNKSSYVQVLLGNGDGTFRTGVRAAAGANPLDIGGGWPIQARPSAGLLPWVQRLERSQPAPAQSAAEIARVIKANSSKWVRTKWNSDFAWQTGYGVFSVSESNVAAVTKYIAEQEEHHKKQSFQEELLAFLKKNKVTYDEKYIWN